jgi:hypothetical protein
MPVINLQEGIIMKKIISSLFILSLFISTQLLAGSVSRSQFTSAIVDREPVDLIETLSTDKNNITYFTELTELQGQTITHQWLYNGVVMFEKSFDVGGPRWRVWTRKSLQPGWSGTWSVNTLDGERNVILSQTFEYQ